MFGPGFSAANFDSKSVRADITSVFSSIVVCASLESRELDEQARGVGADGILEVTPSEDMKGHDRLDLGRRRRRRALAGRGTAMPMVFAADYRSRTGPRQTVSEHTAPGVAFWASAAILVKTAAMNSFALSVPRSFSGPLKKPFRPDTVYCIV